MRFIFPVPHLKLRLLGASRNDFFDHLRRKELVAGVGIVVRIDPIRLAVKRIGESVKVILGNIPYGLCGTTSRRVECGNLSGS